MDRSCARILNLAFSGVLACAAQEGRLIRFAAAEAERIAAIEREAERAASLLGPENRLRVEIYALETRAAREALRASLGSAVAAAPAACARSAETVRGDLFVAQDSAERLEGVTNP